MSIEVRPIRDDELAAFLDAVTTVSLERPDVAAAAEEVRPHWDLARTWAAFDGGTIVGTFRSWAGRLTVPGCREAPVSAITSVNVRPTHRRRGLLSRMAATELAAARERGEIASVLLASEYPIYGRFGYGPASMQAAWTFQPRTTSFLPATDDDGSVDLIPAGREAADLARDIYDAWRVRQPGELWRRPITWDADFGLTGEAWGPRWKGFVAVHRDRTGTPDGYARYHGDEKWADRQPRFTLVVDDLHGVTDRAELALWQFLASFDLVTTIRAERRSLDDRLPWLLTNGRAALPDDVGDGVWVKLLDVAAALEARRYERSGSLVIEIVDGDGVDPDGNAVSRRFRIALDATPDGTRATATDRSPDLTVASGALGAAYLGGTRLGRAALYAGFDEHRPGALAEADALFRTLDSPWCSTAF